jgi:hypothetical protein
VKICLSILIILILSACANASPYGITDPFQLGLKEITSKSGAYVLMAIERTIGGRQINLGRYQDYDSCDSDKQKFAQSYPEAEWNIICSYAPVP